MLTALHWLQFYISTCSHCGLGWLCKEEEPGLLCWGVWGQEAKIKNFCLLFYVLKQHLKLTKFSSRVEGDEVVGWGPERPDLVSDIPAHELQLGDL